MNRQAPHRNARARITLRALLATTAALALAPAAAHAATLSATIGPDPLEDRVFNITATGSDPSNDVYARLREAPGPPCGTSYRAETGDNVFVGDPIGTTTGYVIPHPGTYKICLFQQTSSTSSSASAVAEVGLSVRANVAAVAVQAPPTALEGSLVTFRLVGSTEVPRELYVKSKPAGSGPCAASYDADSAPSFVATRVPANGAFDVPLTTDQYDLPGRGRFVLCAWLQESRQDEIAEAVGSTFITRGPPAPVLSDLHLSPSTLGRRGAVVRFRLNTPSTVRFKVWRRAGGRYVALPGAFFHRGRAGSNAFRYSGRVRSGGRRLRGGRYRLVATARNASGRSNVERRSFRVRR